MIESHPARDDHSRLGRIDQSFFALESRLNLLGGIIIFLIVALTVGNVLGRWIFDKPISGYIDWIEQAMAFFAFLGMAYCQRLGGHVRLSLVIDKFRGRVRWAVELLSVCLMLSVSLILMYGSYLHALRAFELGDSSMDIGLPTWPAKMIVPFAFAVLSIRFSLQIYAYTRGLISGEQYPTAVTPAESHTVTENNSTMPTERYDR